MLKEPGVFSELITGLPEADIPFEGVRGWISQGPRVQTVFFEIEAIGEIPAHSHGAQWGVVVEGEMELTIEGESRACQKGDHYFIPGNAVHSAVFHKKTWVIDVFEDQDRYAEKT
ncbi:conserved hypothetical protein [Candidatus Desulfarcum epimagneticum]|uniref:Cupin type-2 domain-containing protein n=1 Tax=uncultured Desulfobacteraceae bacterium TaxID=218296 RepID=A0A484HGB5_9BACT|nr:conserved hypothetical protein [uncultured Desulfobacteraceae bacterium]